MVQKKAAPAKKPAAPKPTPTPAAPVQAPPAVPAGPPADDPSVAWAKQAYGYGAWVFDDPELGPLLKKAAAEKWSPEVLQGALYKTQWWATHTQAQRAWDQLQHEDFATAKSQIEARNVQLGQEAAKLGVTLTPDRAYQISLQSLRDGWDTSRIESALGAEAHYAGTSTAPTSGTAASLSAKYTQLAAQYGVRVGQDAINFFVQNTLAGTSNDDAVEAWLKGQAKRKYGYIASQIDAGMTPAQWFDSYAQEASHLLERPVTWTDLQNNPKYSAVFGQVDPKTGVATPPSISEWQTYLRELPEYDGTKQAKDDAYGFVSSLGQLFGKTPANAGGF